MAETTEIKMEKATILAIVEGTWVKDKGKPEEETFKNFTFTLQNPDKPGEIVTAVCSQQKLPDNVKQGEVLDNPDLYNTEYQGTVTTRIKFPKEGGYKGKGGYGGYPTPKEDPEAKIVGMAYSYAKDLAIAADGPVLIATVLSDGDAIAVAMQATLKKIKSG